MTRKSSFNTNHKFGLNFFLGICLVFTISCNTTFNNKNELSEGFIKISKKEFRDKVNGAWIGQIVGNIYGLPHENAYIEEPGPDHFSFDYGSSLERLKKADGAFSDDDTDIEYIYLLQMEKFGHTPTYVQLSEAWKYHIRERVWLANRAALGLMHFGFTPPITGKVKYNPHWFQIDPQLVNEIWAVTAPGMVSYAADKSAWAARITNDDWGIEPTIHYGAMFSAAFFESDIRKLIEIGSSALPKNSLFRNTVDEMVRLYEKYPDDWKVARMEMADMYYHNEPIQTKTIWNANLNGACGILALLYGEGDFQKTLDMAVVMGFDADNQTATMCGLLGLANGIETIPDKLLFPVEGWEKPFNNKYVNVTRFDMPDISIEELVNKTVKAAETVIFQNGGYEISEDGQDFLIINTNALFIPPLEIPNGPDPYLEIGKHIEYSIPVVGDEKQLSWDIIEGDLPEGISFSGGMFSGVPKKTGNSRVTIKVSFDSQDFIKDINLLVRGENLAVKSSNTISNVSETNIELRDELWLTVGKNLYTVNVNSINDGIKYGEGSTYYSIDGLNKNKVDYYGYLWDENQTINLIGFNTGAMEEMGGWFTGLSVEFLDTDKKWKSVRNLNITPDLAPGAQPYNKPHFVEYLLSFESVETTGIRIIGNAGGIPNPKTPNFTSISELSIHHQK